MLTYADVCRSEKGELEEMVQVLEEVEEHQVDVC
jgi:hypothetical protein